MAFQRKQLSLDVAHVPNGHCLICRSRRNKVLVKWRAVDAHDLLNMALDGASRLLRVACVPDSHFLIVANGQEDKLVKLVPSNVFDNAIVCCEVGDRLLSELVTVCFLNVPDADAAVITAGQKNALAVLVPGKAVAFLVVPDKSQVCPDLVVLWRARMFRIVKDVYLAVVDRFGSNNLRVLRHISRTVDLALVINLNVDLNTGLFDGN